MTMKKLASVAVVIASAAWATAFGSGVAMAESGQPVTTSAGATLAISTVPSVPAARIVVDGLAYVTNARGKLTLSTVAGQHRITILPPILHRPGVRVRFSRWLDGLALATRTVSLHQGLNSAVAGFSFAYRIRVRFTNGTGKQVPLTAVKNITLANSLGERFTFAPEHPPEVLAANRITRDRFGLVALPIRYSVRDVLFSGAHVVYGGSQNFYVREHRIWTIRLLLFPMQIEVRDALFGFPVGWAVKIGLEGGSGRLVPLGKGHAVTLRGMPRATYDLVAKGPGFGFSSPATLTKPLVARLLLLSWYDVAAVATFAVLFIVGLPLVGGRIRRRGDGARLPGWHVGHLDEPLAADARVGVGAHGEAGQVDEGRSDLAVPAGADLPDGDGSADADQGDERALLDLAAGSAAAPGPNGRVAADGAGPEMPGSGHENRLLDDTAPIAAATEPHLADDQAW
jgi:hypothetical protein